MSADIDKERADFEAAGTELHGWGAREYQRQDLGRYDDGYAYLEQRRAFALWQARAAIPPSTGIAATHETALQFLADQAQELGMGYGVTREVG